ncbi:class I SAM-dependent RNA methyltransferase [Leptospira licerasiae]|uniref:23S rRNA (Uracil-5-)-methyltransferase RumA n=1 Tax=Leptospira licerasiae str. MMD4847 TaxID=1049971 RepID=A0ABN0HCB8_9LEPT|nr:class I SAM-dependent RNA methyltransferase [Leptospira licerasiae]EIE00915.1 putative 23S rRNA (uracil-5-)-methyltransferase RumA [Leptospira licerasiae serovar Varillal str. VAR 010]EJZ43149.1 putative 23S rRNA (uracil-5-)-methyltransferase RumA [Leptospira licerasiae str. MMD4847]
MFDQEPFGVLEIENLLPNLRGEGTLGKRKIEIPYSLPGDVYDVYKFGKRKVFYKWNPTRLEPRASSPKCPSFGECGGCSGQHLLYPDQFKLTSEPILKGLENFNTIHKGTSPAESSYSYRNRMDFAVFPGRVVGLRMSGNFRRIVPISNCSIQTDWANSEMPLFQKLLECFPELEYDRKKETGYLKYLTLRKSVFNDDSMSILTFTEDFKNEDLMDRVAEKAKEILSAKNIVFCFNRKKGEISASGEALAIRGNIYLIEEIWGKKFKIPFDGFFQPNPKEFIKILEFIRSKIKPAENLADLFCGSGFFSILFGENFSRILGIDIISSSVSAGEEFLQEVFPDKKIEFLAFDLFHKKGLERMSSANLPWKDSVVIADPPRSGLSPELCAFLNSNPVSQLIYISCNPENLLRDARILEGSYQMEEFLLCDPFPQTPHLEAVSIFSPKNR